MIVAFSLMRRRQGIDREAFNRHWRDPHGALVCQFPRLRRYSQNRIAGSAALTPLARRLALDGIAELAYDSDADQEAATGSPAMAACDRDSPAFIGAVVRVVSETADFEAPVGNAGCAKLITLFPPAAATHWHGAYADAMAAAEGVAARATNATIRQRGPNSAMPVLDFPIRLIEETWFRDAAALERAAAALPAACGEAIASYAIEELRLI